MIANSTFRASEPTGQGRHRCLLVVDAAEESRAALADYFHERGYEVITAADGIEAVAQTVTRRVDVVIMNATLPGLEGYEAAPILRKVSPGLQIILTMEAEAEESRQESQRMERFRCFPKPVDFESLARAIDVTGPGQAAGEPGGVEGAR